MKVLIIGYGKMGRTIEALARERDHSIVAAIDSFSELKEAVNGHSSIDVAIEFSQPESAFENIKFCLENSIPVVSGTTGWLDKRPAIEKICTDLNGAFFYASNYSIGVNLFFKLNSFLAGLMGDQSQYTPSMKEIHHTEKLDEPSGTAITLAEGIIEKNKRISNWTLGKDVNSSNLSIESERLGKVPGTHIVNYRSDIDRIEITHEAFGREGFAMGALHVAEWVKDQKGVLSMDDFLKL